MSQVDCPKCKGKGEVKCPKCGGDAFAKGIKNSVNQFIFQPPDDPCDRCDDSFHVPCNKCGGTGTVDEEPEPQAREKRYTRDDESDEDNEEEENDDDDDDDDWDNSGAYDPSPPSSYNRDSDTASQTVSADSSSSGAWMVVLLAGLVIGCAIFYARHRTPDPVTTVTSQANPPVYSENDKTVATAPQNSTVKQESPAVIAYDTATKAPNTFSITAETPALLYVSRSESIMRQQGNDFDSLYYFAVELYNYLYTGEYLSRRPPQAPELGVKLKMVLTRAIELEQGSVRATVLLIRHFFMVAYDYHDELLKLKNNEPEEREKINVLAAKFIRMTDQCIPYCESAQLYYLSLQSLTPVQSANYKDVLYIKDLMRKDKAGLDNIPYGN